MAAIPAHEFNGRGASILVKYNWFASNCVSVREVPNPRDLVPVNILEDDRRFSWLYVPGVVIAASTVIEHDNHRKAALVILQGVTMPAAIVSGAMARPAPVTMVRIVIPVVPMIVAVSPIVPIRPVSI